MKEYLDSLGTSKKLLITGGAGFIGYHLCNSLLKKGFQIVAFDNLNDYYDIDLKYRRLERLKKYSRFKFVRGELAIKSDIEKVFQSFHPDIIINLAAQAGVRYSIDNPETYIESNIIGFFNLLECCRYYPVEHLIFASSSSVYGGNQKVPFSTSDMTDRPVSLYAATKKSNELMAHCYSKLYGIPTTGLRFFTVYGPFGRPDMAYYKFSQKIISGEPIQIYNNGNMLRDFTYIDDIIEGIERLLNNSPYENELGTRYAVYNLGNNKPEKLMDLIEILEKHLNRTAIKEYLPMQPGDVYQTYADVSDMVNIYGFQPKTSLDDGIQKFVHWFLDYYSID